MPTELLKGTLNMMVLRTVRLGPMHGLGIARRIQQLTGGQYDVGPGSLFPALHRLEDKGLIVGEWGESENNRRARFYRLTGKGERAVAVATREWQRASTAIMRLIEATG